MCVCTYGVYIYIHIYDVCVYIYPILVSNANNGGGYACVGAERI